MHFVIVAVSAGAIASIAEIIVSCVSRFVAEPHRGYFHLRSNIVLLEQS
jgi:hypothetical protein